MEINDDMVEKLAVLARLHFDSLEKEAIKNDLQKMVSFIDKLNELDTNGISPLLHITENRNVLRPDIISTGCSRDEALSNAPVHNNEFFQVPKVITK